MGEPSGLFETLDLTEYEARALAELLTLGRTTAPNLAEATDVPKARIYGVLDALADAGYVKVIPGRPKEYQSRSPAEIVERAEENRRQAFESFRQELDERRDPFLDEYQPRYEAAGEDITPAEELFHVVDVGEPSEAETRRLYHEADDRVRVITKSLGYLDSVVPAVEDALDRGIDVAVLFLHPDYLGEDNAQVQADIVDRVDASGIDHRFSTGPLPWRGTVVDPAADYSSGEAIFLVEEEDVPNHMRQAAITENGSFVFGLQRYFELVWDHESVADAT